MPKQVLMGSLVAIAVVGILWAWSPWADDAKPPVSGAQAGGIAPPASPAASASSNGTATTTSATGTPVMPAPPQAAAMAAPSPIAGSPPPSGAAVPAASDLGLRRVLGGPNDVFSLDGRQTVVMGSKPDASFPDQQVVALRDAQSGQLSMVGEGLKIQLAPNADARAFIAGFAPEQVLLATTSGIDLRIDAARLAAEYTRLKADPRVVSVQLINPPIRKTSQ